MFERWRRSTTRRADRAWGGISRLRGSGKHARIDVIRSHTRREPRCSLHRRCRPPTEITPHSAVRPARLRGGKARAVRRLGDAGPVHRNPGGAPRGPHRCRDVRRLAHGPGADPRAAGARVPAADALQRRAPDAGGRGPVQRDVPRGRWRARRPLHLPAGRLRVPDGHQRRQPREGSRLAAVARRRVRRRRDRPPRGLRDARGPGPEGPSASSPPSPTGRCRRACTAASARRRGADARLRHRLHGRGRRRAAARPRATRRGSGTPSPSAGATPGRARRARHAAPRGLLSPVRQRSERGSRPDRGRPRLVLQGADRLHRLRGLGGRARGRAAGEARPVRRSRAGDRAPGQPGDRRRGGHERDVLAVPGARNRNGVRFQRARRARHADRDRRARHDSVRPSSSASLSTERGREHGRGQLSGRPPVPRRARLGANRGETGHVRDHLVRPGLARRGRVLRPAGGRHRGQPRTSPTPRSSRSRRSRT